MGKHLFRIRQTKNRDLDGNELGCLEIRVGMSWIDSGIEATPQKIRRSLTGIIAINNKSRETGFRVKPVIKTVKSDWGVFKYNALRLEQRRNIPLVDAWKTIVSIGINDKKNVEGIDKLSSLFRSKIKKIRESDKKRTKPYEYLD